ncbi:MAG: putative response regulator, CheY [Pedosphaera sp.]|nr:putative response regulator, CheY [Pedosphaera sp.]
MTSTILLAEDSTDDELFFKRILLSVGVLNALKVTRDGKETIAYLKGEGDFADRDLFPLPGVLFLDLKMAPVDGWEVLLWLKARPEFNKLLIVVLTNYDGTKELHKAYALGAHSFLIKPFKELDMKGLLEQFPGYWILTLGGPKRPGDPNPRRGRGDASGFTLIW